MIYKVIDKMTNNEVYRYTSDSPVEWNGLDFNNFEHIQVTENTPNPPPQVFLKKWINPYEFLREFTIQEQVAIRSAAKTDPIIEAFLEMLTVAPSVENSNPDTIAALEYFTQNNLLTPLRKEAILYG